MRNLFNLYIFELKQNVRLLIIWIVVISITMFLYMCIFPSMSSSDFVDIVNAKINFIPKALSEPFGLNNVTGTDFQNVFFFFCNMFQYFVIAIIVYAISLGATILSKENTEKHIDYLATKPIKKSYIVLAKYKAFVTLLIIMSTILYLVGLLIIQIFNKQNVLYTEQLATVFVKLFFVYLLFGSLAFFLSAISKKTAKTNMLVVSIFFVSYLVGVASGLVSALSNFKYLSPYFMLQATKIYNGFNKTEIIYLAILLLLSVLMLAVSVWRYSKKDLSL